jgi:hypothetical protein
MLAVLSASATKRGIYLLPVLPLIALPCASLLAGWFEGAGRRASPAWWSQLACCTVLALGVPPAALAYAHRRDQFAIGLAVVLAAAPLAAFIASAVATCRRAPVAIALLAWGALLTAAGAVVLAPRLFEADKDLSPLVAWVDRALPAGEPVYAVDPDETLVAIIPFLSGRHVIALPGASFRNARGSGVSLPARVLIQDKPGASGLGPGYRIVATRKASTGRTWSLWDRETAPQ